MLSSLTVQNLVLVEHAHLVLRPGLIAIAGETGAGKSLLLGSLALIGGERASADFVGREAEDAAVSAVFQVPGGDMHELRRVIRRSGNHIARIDGDNVPLSALRDWVHPRVQLHTQDESRMLRDPQEHRAALDRWLADPAVLDAVHTSFEELGRHNRTLADLQALARSRTERMAYLEFQVRRLEPIAVDPDTYQQMLERAEVSRHRARLQDAVAYSLDALADGEANAEALIGTALGKVRALAHDVQSLGELVQQLDDTSASLDSAIRLLRSHHKLADAESPEDLESQVGAIQQFARETGINPDQQMAQLQLWQRELADLTQYDDRLAQLIKVRDKARKDYDKCAQTLTRARKQAGEALMQAASVYLRELALPDARLQFALEPAEPSPHGSDTVTLLFAAHHDLPPRPIQKVASGGELSRVLLALLAAEAVRLTPRTVVFDEIDAGVGGETSLAIAQVLRALARHHQVIVITHLAQVAAAADQHFLVQKEAVKQRTTTSVRELSGEARVRDLARMLGSASSPESQSLARHLLERFAA